MVRNGRLDRSGGWFMRLLHGDTLEQMALLPDGCADMILCDLPYGTTACKWDTVIPFEPLWEQYKRLIKKNGAIVLFGSEPFSSLLRVSNLKQYKYDWIWDKLQGSAFTLAKIQPLKSHEIISVFGDGRLNYFPQMIARDIPLDTTKWKQDTRNSENGNYSSKDNSMARKEYTHKYPLSVFPLSRSNGECNNSKRVHPTQKPVALCEYLIRTYTNEGDTVLDNCMGSGTTGVAARNTNRHFIGIERDAEYFAIAQCRIAGLM